MAADVGLIKSVSDAYKYQNPNFGKELSQPILEGEDRRRLQKEKLRLEQKVNEERVQKEIKSYLDLYPPGIPLSKIPDKYRPKITEFSFKQKKLYSDAVSARANMQAGTDEYQEQTDIMNNSLQAVNNLKSQWNAFGANKEDNFSNFDDQNFSKANNMDGIALNAAIYTDQFDAEIGDQGDLSFLDGQGNSFNLRDVDQPFLKAADEALYIETQLVKAFDKGVRLSDASLDLTMSQIRNIIIKGGTDALKSLAVDDLVAGVSLYEPGEDILKRLDSNDPEEAVLAREQLQRELLSKYRTSLKSQANQGYLAKNPAEASAEAENEASGKMIRDMVISDEPTNIVKYYTDDKGKRVASSVNTEHSLNQSRISFYNEAAFSSNPLFKITNINAKEDDDGTYDSGDAADGVHVTDKSGSIIGGPFYTEEDLAGFLNRQRSQK